MLHFFLLIVQVQFEDERKSEEKDYWLRMYQRLMDSKPEALILEVGVLAASS